jgi:hypothetical protein
LFGNGEELQIGQGGPGDSVVGESKELDKNLVDVHEVGDLELVPLPLKVEDVRWEGDGSVGSDTMIYELSLAP